MTQLAEKQPKTRAEWAAHYGRVRSKINAPRQVDLALPPPVPAQPAPEPPPASGLVPVPRKPPLSLSKLPPVPRKPWRPEHAQTLGTYTPPGQHKAYSTLQVGVLAAVPRPAPNTLVQGHPAVELGAWAPPRVTYRSTRSRYVVNHVVAVVCQRYMISRERLVGQQRAAEVVRPRQVAMYLIRHLTNLSLPHVGGTFGGRDHTTVLCAIRRVEQLRQRVPELDELVRDVLGSFGC